MSIIERAEELLKSEAKGQHGASDTRAKRETHLPHVMERASSQVAEPAYTEPRRETATSNAAGRYSTPASRHFAVDRARLRALSLIMPDGERTMLGETFRRLKRQILGNLAQATPGVAPANTVLVTSTVAGEGKTFCAINLAISLALERDRTVLLVDADVAKPSVPRALGLHAEAGLMEVLLDRHVDYEDAVWNTDIGGLTVMPAGKAHQHAAELFASHGMRRLVRDMAERHNDQIVVFDSPPLLAASEAGALAGQVGQIVVVVEAGKTSESALKRALSVIDSSKVTGLVLNKLELTFLEHSYDGYD